MIIDIHQHVNWYGYDAVKLVNHLNSLKVDKAWLLSVESINGGREPAYQHLSIDDAYRTWQEYPEKFIPFAAVDPRRENAEDILRQWVKKGIKGYGELKIRACYDNPDVLRIFKVCGELGLPVLFHLQMSLPPDYTWYGGSIENVERAVKLCPETTFIGHGPGWWAEISGDGKSLKSRYPKGPVKPGKLLKILEKYDNLYADLSARSGLNALQRDRDFTLRFIPEFQSKLLYGTDYFDSALLDYLKSLNLDEPIFESLTYKNAQRIIPT
jgi:predicted TIM-barrel fold metal-dependent hydrolase